MAAMSDDAPDFMAALRLADALGPLHDAALPEDAPGAWVRAAVERTINDALGHREENPGPVDAS